jgi:BirA family biotin operon repressor/biotin-[acetyl-CoA-carboxylase] ligase
MTPVAEWKLDTFTVGRRVLVFECLDSTNTFALQFAGDPTNDGLVILADEQTAGRGQHGRTWQSPGGAGVLMSFLIFPPAPVSRPAMITGLAAVAVCEWIQKTTGLKARIKWPNDVLIEERKVCGILIERTQGIVVGVGLNVNQQAAHFEEAGLTQAASLAVFTGQTRPCREVARELTVEFDAAYAQLALGNVADLESRWTARLGLVGQQVIAETASGVVDGRLRKLGFATAIIATVEAEISLTPETIKHLWAVNGA